MDGKYSTRQIQLRVLEILQWFHGFCVEHDLTYYAIGGTLLGAVRHGGFIPWDDDVDVGMPRPDYDRFVELMKSERGRFAAETISDGKKEFTYRHCKLFDTTTTAVHFHKYEIKRGLFIDVFPLDGAGNTRAAAHKLYKKFKRRDHLFAAKTTYKFNRKHKFYENIAAMLARLLPLNRRRAVEKMHAFCCRTDYYTSVFVGNFFGMWREREIVERAWMGTPTLKRFENIEIYCPEDSDKYLTSIYGDYMTPPPEDKRHPGHSCLYLNFDEPYMSAGESNEQGEERAEQ